MVVAGALLLSACSSTTAASTPSATAAAAKDITVPIASAITTMDPLTDVSASTSVTSAIFQSLTYLGTNGLQPYLASKWKTSDNATWTFTIRKGATWSDGSPVTAADVVFSIETDASAANPHASYFSSMKSVSAVNSSTVRFVLKTPNAAWPVVLGDIFIVPAKVYKAEGSAAFGAKPVGSAAYKFDSTVSGGGVKIVANSDYVGGTPPFHSVTFTPVTSPQSQIAGLQSGQLDVVAQVPVNQVASVSATSGVHIVSSPSTNTIYLGYNTTNPALANPDVRKAIDMAIDRNAIVKNLFLGKATALGGMVPKGTTGYDAALKPTAYDVAASKALLKKGGYTGQTITLSYPSTNLPEGDDLSKAVGAYLTAVGIKVSLQPLDLATFFTQWAAHKLPGVYLLQYLNSADAEYVVTSLFAADSRAMFTDAKTAALVDAERSAVGTAARATALDRLWDQALTSERYYSPILAPDVEYGVRDGVDFTAMPYGSLVVTYLGT